LIVSAFARLRQLQTRAAASPAPLPTQDEEVEAASSSVTPVLEKRSRPRRTRATTAQTTSESAIATADTNDKDVGALDVQAVLEGAVVSASQNGLELLSPDEPLQAMTELTIHFSNFHPTKANFQRKSSGKLQLKLSSGDVCMILAE
jgi:hypothetical protein